MDQLNPAGLISVRATLPIYLIDLLQRRAVLFTDEGEKMCPPNKIVQNVFDIKTLLQIFMNTVFKLYFKTIIIK